MILESLAGPYYKNIIFRNLLLIGFVGVLIKISDHMLFAECNKFFTSHCPYPPTLRK